MAYASPDATTRSRPMTSEEKKVILASSLGTVFEWYDFYLWSVPSARLSSGHWVTSSGGNTPSWPRS